jgi:hypothetical protein
MDGWVWQKDPGPVRYTPARDGVEVWKFKVRLCMVWYRWWWCGGVGLNAK